MVLKLFTRPHNNFPPTANAKIRHFQTHLTFSVFNIFQKTTHFSRISTGRRFFFIGRVFSSEVIFMVLKLFTIPKIIFRPLQMKKCGLFQTHLTFSFFNIFLIFLKKTSQHRKGIFFHRQSVFIGGHLHGLIGVHSGKNNSPPRWWWVFAQEKF